MLVARDHSLPAFAAPGVATTATTTGDYDIRLEFSLVDRYRIVTASTGSSEMTGDYILHIPATAPGERTARACERRVRRTILIGQLQSLDKRVRKIWTGNQDRDA